MALPLKAEGVRLMGRDSNVSSAGRKQFLAPCIKFHPQRQRQQFAEATAFSFCARPSLIGFLVADIDTANRNWQQTTDCGSEALRCASPAWPQALLTE
jgi:hypothetical protein